MLWTREALSTSKKGHERSFRYRSRICDYMAAKAKDVLAVTVKMTRSMVAQAAKSAPNSNQKEKKCGTKNRASS